MPEYISAGNAIQTGIANRHRRTGAASIINRLPLKKKKILDLPPQEPLFQHLNGQYVILLKIMKTIFGLAGATIAGSIGWWIGDQIGLFTALLLSGVGSGLGMYAGRRFVKDYMGG